MFFIIVYYFLCSYYVNGQNKTTQQTFYTCVMHPEIHEPKAGNCPKCGMILIKEKTKISKKNIVKKPITAKKVFPTYTKENSEVKKEVVASKTENSDLPEIKPVFENKIITKTISKTVRYDLYVRDNIVTIGNKPKRAIAVNGQIPMPTLTFTEGDTAEIYVHNELKESTSLHWHGLMLPNREDGVPNLTQMPIKSGTTHK